LRKKICDDFCQMAALTHLVTNLRFPDKLE